MSNSEKKFLEKNFRYFWVFINMRIIILEEQYNRLKEQISLSTLTPKVMGVEVVELVDKVNNYVDNVRPDIESRGKKLFPVNDMVVKNPNFKNTPQYRELKDKEDAYDHQLASAVAASMFGPQLSDIIGKANEVRGGLRMFFKGSSSKGVGKFEQFTSGWEEDNNNNRIGIEIGKRYPNKDINFYSNEVMKNIQSGNYYDSTGKKKS